MAFSAVSGFSGVQFRCSYYDISNDGFFSDSKGRPNLSRIRLKEDMHSRPNKLVISTKGDLFKTGYMAIGKYWGLLKNKVGFTSPSETGDTTMAVKYLSHDV